MEKPTDVSVWLYVPNDDEHGVIGQKAIYGARLKFDNRPMLGEQIRVHSTISDETWDMPLIAVISEVNHVPSDYANEADPALQISAKLADISYHREAAEIRKVLTESGIWTCHSIS